MSLEKRINAFVQLGLFLKQFENSVKNELVHDINNLYYNEFEELIDRQKAYNGWFTRDNVISAVVAIGDSLTLGKLDEFLSEYKIADHSDKTIGVIMAGNIPLVGFHDMFCVLITGNRLHAKLSSTDNTLIKKIAEILITVEPEFAAKISFVDKLEKFDAVIATGSNNTSRYFHHYFGKYPHIIRKNRNSVAIIHQNDSMEDIKPLGKDVFQYFGLGCRSVSKLYIPKGYRLDTIFEAFYEDYQNITDNNKYANNYDYNKAVYLLGNNKLLDNGFLLLKESPELTSPVGVLNYEFYDSITQLQAHLHKDEKELQCIVASNNMPIDALLFGKAQCPELRDYADGIDTIRFLMGLA